MILIKKYLKKCKQQKSEEYEEHWLSKLPSLK